MPIKGLNRSHPSFDIVMEFLCLLPREPLYAYAEHVASDLGIAHSTLQTTVMPRAREAGYNIFYRTHYSQPIVGIRKEDWAEHVAACEVYWDIVYGSQA